VSGLSVSPIERSGPALWLSIATLLLSGGLCPADDPKAPDPQQPIKKLFGPVKILDPAEEEAQAFQAWLTGGLRQLNGGQRPNRADAEEVIAAAASQTQIERANEVLDKILFGPETTGIDDARTRLETILDQKISLIDRLCSLSEAQTRKLRLAGRGDAHRVFERARLLREKLPEAVADGVTIEFARETRDLHHLVRHGAFGEGSMFAKSLRKVLTPEQIAEYSRARHDLKPKVRELLPDLNLKK